VPGDKEDLRGGSLPRHEAIPRNEAAIDSLGPLPFDVLVFRAMNVYHGGTQIGMTRFRSRDDSTCIGCLTGHSAASCAPGNLRATDRFDANNHLSVR
jgi:hypothetical protein